MYAATQTLVFFAALVASAAAGNTPSGDTCTPVTTVLPFDLAAYASAPWFVQQQMPVRYQPEESLYCVRASYKLQDDGSVSVLNTANIGGTGEYFFFRITDLETKVEYLGLSVPRYRQSPTGVARARNPFRTDCAMEVPAPAPPRLLKLSATRSRGIPLRSLETKGAQKHTRVRVFRTYCQQVCQY